MSSGNNGGGTNGTLAVAGPKVIQTGDFYVHSSLLHPFVIGSIAILFLFTVLRFLSNRSIAPMNTFDWLVNVALGSTLAGIVNGNSLVRGLFGLITMLVFQWLTSFLGVHFHERLTPYLSSPPLVIAFRGRMLEKVMKSHRISTGDFYAALRQQNILSLSQIECVIIESNGSFSVYTKEEIDGHEGDPEVLMEVPGYKALYCDAEEKKHTSDSKRKPYDRQKSTYSNHEADEQQNEVAKDCA